ncbi:IclR family transcriptional regulator [Paenibacillus alginolyticus]|uniref:IclR family transcriptional regulator n=1 Tax=Paenibacillus alginolyticus TaxID=59839 RepID=A0ABT4GLZ2_9BACL|nr:IclR family transcriptional regulator [Paenibacillus alginolyticus]MCY9670236.1 IclR family transcriptional regulator [Paenibacillus alginolyticus]MCY9697101.1 IclR family transcriptional regulator [Paenibacillus alginolyticus]MEC0146270.1 IclR family transcriptional regulator [Paenibacillus alginolyticus]
MENHLSSVKNSSRLLKTFLDSHKEMGVSELSRQLGLSKGAVHKLLMTLESEGFIKQNPANKQYSLGYTLLELGNKVLRNHNLTDFSKPFLQKLAKTTEELVCLCVRDERDAIYVDKIEDSQHPIRFNVEAYRRFPLYATSASRAILAFQDHTFIEDILLGEIRTYTPYSLKEPEEIKELLKSIQQRGFEVSSNRRNVGVTGIAAPIFEASGAVNASISIIGPTDRVLPVLDTLIQQAVATTKEISAQLGYRGK